MNIWHVGGCKEINSIQFSINLFFPGVPTNVSCQLFVASLSSINTENMVSFFAAVSSLLEEISSPQKEEDMIIIIYIFLSRSFAEYDAVFHFERTIKDFLRPTVLFTFPQCIFLPFQLQCFHYSLSNSKELLLVATSAIQCVITAMQQTASSIPNYSRTNISILYCKTKTQYSGEILGAGTIVLHRKLYHCNHKYVQITHWFSGHVPNHPSWLNVTVISEYMHVTVATPSGYYVLRIHTKTSK